MTPAERVREQMRRLLREAPPADGGAPAFGIGPTPVPTGQAPIAAYGVTLIVVDGLDILGAGARLFSTRRR